MLSLILAFLATLLAAYNGPAARLLVQISRKQGKRPSLLSMAVMASGLCSLLALWLASMVPHLALSPHGHSLLAGLALLLAASQMVRPRASQPPLEPTNSLFAALLVFVAKQTADSPRWLLLGLALLSPAQAHTALGGIIGPALALTIAWALA